MHMCFASEMEALGYEIDVLKKTSREIAFSQYLCNVESRLIGNPTEAVNLRNELIQNYSLYCSRINTGGIIVPNDFWSAVYPNMTAPIIDTRLEGVNARYEGIYANQGISYIQKSNSILNNVSAYENNAPINNSINTINSVNINNPIDVNKASEYANNVSLNSNITSNKKNKGEFAIGAIVLSVLGVSLIIAGAIMLSVNFFDSVWQGISMYFICAILFLFSELVIRRFVEKLSSVISSLSLVGFLR